MPPGTWISQVQLAKRFGVSRGPIREALRLLEREGLIETAVNQRSKVSAFSIDDLEQLYAARIAVEGLGIASSVPRFTQADLNELGGLLETLDALAGKDVQGWDTTHRAFHAALVKHAGARLVGMLDELYDHAERYRRVYIAGDPRAWSVGAAEHRQIVDACTARDSRLAAGLLARHLSRTALAGLTLMAPEHEPALLRTAVRQVTAALGSGSLSVSRQSSDLHEAGV